MLFMCFLIAISAKHSSFEYRLSVCSERDEPLPSLVLANDYRAIGTLGPSIAADVARLASMIGAIRTTLTAVASGRYSHLDHPGKIDLLEGELILWRDIEIFGKRVAKRLAHVATSGRLG